MEQELGGRAKIVRHKGVEIFIADCSGLRGRELMEAMKDNATVIVPKIMGRKDCVIVNLFRNCQLDEDSLKYLTKIQKAMDGTFIASANVGMSATQKAAIEITDALKASHFPYKFFDDEKEAMDWAAEQYKKFADRPR